MRTCAACVTMQWIPSSILVDMPACAVSVPLEPNAAHSARFVGLF